MGDMRAFAVSCLAVAGCAFTPSGLAGDGDAATDSAVIDGPGGPDGAGDPDGATGTDAAETDAAVIDAAAIDAAPIDAAAIDAPPPIDAAPIDAPPDPFCTSTGLQACFRMNQGSGAPVDGHAPPITIARADAANYIASCPNHGTALDLSAGVFVRTGAPAAALTALSVEAWVKLAHAAQIADGRRFWFDADNSWGLSYARDINGNTQVQCLVVIGVGNFPTATATLPNPTAWNHVACTFDGDRLRLFINGVKSENNVSGSSNEIQGADVGVQIGRDGVDQGGATEGQIDDVRIWNRRVPDADIAAIANAGCQ